MNTRGSTAIWVGLLLITMICATMAWTRLAGLPDLGMLVGPDLTVRQVAMERGPVTEGQPFQRGDRLISVGSMSLESLQDLREVLPPLISEAPPMLFDGEELEGRDVVVLEYQILRPLHRFSLAMQGEPIDPTSLPPGVEPDDKLVEIDGRPQPGRIGIEGLRSVISSRPDALLGLERSNAVFSGQIKLDRPSTHPGVMLAFLLVLGVIGVLWRWHSDAVGARAAYCISLETLCLGWLTLLVFGFQWVLADYLLASGVIASLTLMRPLAIFAREQGENNGGKISLAIGGFAAIAIIGLMYGGYLPGPEEALQAAAITAGLFIIYELTASGIEGDPSTTLGERWGYLSGVVVLGLFACLVAAVMQPVAFTEERWRFFAVLLPSLVWFGDVMYGVKYGVRSAMGDVADRNSRKKLLQNYLREIALEMPHTDLRIVGQVDGRAMAVRRTKEGVEIAAVSSALADAVEILLRENARIPLPEGIDRLTHPMEGIAKAMHISIALPLTAPAGSLSLGGNEVDVALVGMRESRDGDIPVYASTQTLDRAQELWNGSVASAAVIEILSGLFAAGARALPATDGTAAGTAGAELHRELEEAREAAVHCQEERAVVIEERDGLQESLQITEHQLRLREVASYANYSGLDEAEGLLEPELLEGLKYLLQDLDPIVFGGPHGAGKGYAANRAHLLDGRPPGKFLFVDTSETSAAKKLDVILGEVGGGIGPGLLKGFEGSLLVRGAQRCDDARMLALCHQTEDKGVRLYLSFDAPNIEDRSVLDGRPAPLLDLLQHREVIIPRLSRRPIILRPVLQYWLGEWAYRYGKKVDGFSRMALEALEAYDYPGQVVEAVEIVRYAVMDTQHDVVDRENLPLHVREADPI